MSCRHFTALIGVSLISQVEKDVEGGSASSRVDVNNDDETTTAAVYRPELDLRGNPEYYEINSVLFDAHHSSRLKRITSEIHHKH